MKFKGILALGALFAMLGAAGCSSNVPTDYYYNNNGERLRNSIKDVVSDDNYTNNYNYDRYNDDTLLGRRYPNTLNKVEPTKNYVTNSPTANRLSNNIYKTTKKVTTVPNTTTNNRLSNNIYNTTNRVTTVPNTTTNNRLSNNIYNTTNRVTTVPNTTTTNRLSNNIYDTTKKVTTVPNANNAINAPRVTNNITRTMDSVRVPSNVPSNSALSNHVYDRYELRNADFNYVTDNGRKIVIEESTYPTTNTIANNTMINQ